MPRNALSSPDPSEYAPYYWTYIGQVPDDNVAELLHRQRTAFEPLRTLTDSQALERYAADKWTVKQVIGHINDAERVFAYRMLRIGRGDATALAGFDQQPYVDIANFDRLPLATLVDSFETARASTLSIVTELDESAWPRMGTASGFPVSARALAFIIAGHVIHHAAILREKYGLGVITA